jgi:hypothetical protein
VERSLGQVMRPAFGDMPPDTVLTANEAADWLKVARRQAQRLGIPWIVLGRKTPRYQVGCPGEARASPSRRRTPRDVS